MEAVERTINLEKIIINPRLWLRGIIGTRSVQGFQEHVVAEYSELLEHGVDMGRLSVVDECDDTGRSLGALLLVDGFHRFEAIRRLGWTEVKVVVYAGTFDDALILACELNSNRGLRYTPLGEVKAVKAYLTACWHKGQNPTNNEIALRLGFLHERVERARALLVEQGDLSTYLPIKRDKKTN
jgi:hypothetical protein